MNIREIATPCQLRDAWNAQAIGHGEAMLIVMHRIDPSNVDEWIAALAPAVRDDFIGYARARATRGETFQIGRGLTLPESPTAIEALVSWLALRDLQGTTR